MDEWVGPVYQSSTSKVVLGYLYTPKFFTTDMFSVQERLLKADGRCYLPMTHKSTPAMDIDINE